MLVQHHPILLNATCWIRLNILLDDDGLSWSSLIGEIFFCNIRPTWMNKKCWTMQDPFEWALTEPEDEF